MYAYLNRQTTKEKGNNLIIIVSFMILCVPFGNCYRARKGLNLSLNIVLAMAASVFLCHNELIPSFRHHHNHRNHHCCHHAMSP